MGFKKWGLFACGALFGSAGIRILSSKDAKNMYTMCTAAVLRAKDVIVDQATLLQENCEDIYEGAKAINQALYEEEAAAEMDAAEEEMAEEATEA